MLWGVSMVNTGFNRAFGAELRRLLARSTGNRFKAMLSGIAATLVLQSSTAAVLILSSFAARSLIQVPGGIAVVLGADIGTTLVAQILTFDLSLLVPILLAAGYVINKALSGGQYKHVGRAMIGIALILLSLKMVVTVSEPLRSSAALAALVESLSSEPLLAVMLAALLTWVAHSSLAMVLLFASFVGMGTIPPQMGLMMILGANLGGAIAPVMMTLGENSVARRIPLANLLMRGIFVIVTIPFLPLIGAELFAQDGVLNTALMKIGMGGDLVRQTVSFHMLFNFALAFSFIFLTRPVAALTAKILPEKQGEEEEKGRARYLDNSALTTPPAALSCAMRETLRMSDYIQRMLRDTLESFKTHNLQRVQDIREQDNIVDGLYEDIKRYMAQMSGQYLDKKESQRYLEILTFATNLEHIGDIIDKSLMEMAAKKIRNQYTFSEEGFQEIAAMHGVIMENLRVAQNVFMSGDMDMAYKLVEEKAAIRKSELRASESHIERLRKGVAETVATSSLHLDILRDLRRINSYLTAVAYPILEKAGVLHKTHLKKKPLRNKARTAPGTLPAAEPERISEPPSS